MSQVKREFRLTGGHVLAMVLGFFGIIFAANIALVYYSQTSWNGLLPKNGYQASKEYNAELAKAQALLAKGWKAALGVGKDGRVIVALKDREGQPLSGLVAKAKIGRPVNELEDREVVLVERRIGYYSTPGPLKPGAWTVDVRFTRNG